MYYVKIRVKILLDFWTVYEKQMKNCNFRYSINDEDY